MKGDERAGEQEITPLTLKKKERTIRCTRVKEKKLLRPPSEENDCCTAHRIGRTRESPDSKKSLFGGGGVKSPEVT